MVFVIYVVFNMVYDTVLSHLGQQTRKHQDLFDDNGEEMLNKKQHAYRALQLYSRSAAKKAVYNAIRYRVHAGLLAKLQGRRDTEVCGLQQHKAFLRRSEGNLSDSALWNLATAYCRLDRLTRARWAKHFRHVFNRPSSINDMPQVPVNTYIDNSFLTESPTEQEVQHAIDLLSNGKAPGSDSIQVYKAGESVMVQ
ncbi:Hypp4485 [Branchiostoma lanceolatum]|uniref:Hypp4485 protein n=1 Tax=Branchiostoma lanceolatum TaxID=7740 RepID=A0A8K0EYM5_BRALA|nr:Hypp4485 [Branchiostoma lanceolatum]